MVCLRKFLSIGRILTFFEKEACTESDNFPINYFLLKKKACIYTIKVKWIEKRMRLVQIDYFHFHCHSGARTGFWIFPRLRGPFQIFFKIFSKGKRWEVKFSLALRIASHTFFQLISCWYLVEVECRLIPEDFDVR